MRRRTRSVVVAAGLGVAVLWFVASSINDYVVARRARAYSAELRAQVKAHSRARDYPLDVAVPLFYSAWVAVLALGLYLAVWGGFGIWSAVTGQAVEW